MKDKQVLEVMRAMVQYLETEAQARMKVAAAMRKAFEHVASEVSGRRS